LFERTLDGDGSLLIDESSLEDESDEDEDDDSDSLSETQLSVTLRFRDGVAFFTLGTESVCKSPSSESFGLAFGDELAVVGREVAS
jgi:hypothetical protein